MRLGVFFPYLHYLEVFVALFKFYYFSELFFVLLLSIYILIILRILPQFLLSATACEISLTVQKIF